MEKMAKGKRAMKALFKPFVGKWIIVEMEAWNQEFVNMEGLGHFTFSKDGTGHFRFGLVRGEMDCRMENASGKVRVEFSWEGNDELVSCLGNKLTLRSQRLSGIQFPDERNKDKSSSRGGAADVAICR